MKILSVVLLLCSFCLAEFHSGVLAGAANDAKSAGKVASYPVRHPKKSAGKVFGAGKSSAKAAGKAVKASAKFAAQI